MVGVVAYGRSEFARAGRVPSAEVMEKYGGLSMKFPFIGISLPQRLFFTARRQNGEI